MPSKVSSGHKSVKHEIIDKAGSRMLLAVAGATFVLVFSIFASKSLISQSLYHGRVIGEKEKTLEQLKDNQKSLEQLSQSYAKFEAEQVNILGGDPNGQGALDGKNAKITLDALPNSYDYPGLSSSFEKILRDGAYDIGSIGGTEDPSLAVKSSTSGKAEPVEIPYAFTVKSDTAGTQRLLQTLERSIRPMYVDTLLVQTGETVLQTRVSLHTYFSQAKTFELGSKEVK